jgi:hypothetical protein
MSLVLENDIVRVLVLPDGRLNQPRTFAIAPGAEDIAQEGRDRFDLAGFTQPEFALEADTESLRIQTAAIRLTVRLAGFLCSWALRLGTEWRPAASNRLTQAYNFGWWDERVKSQSKIQHLIDSRALPGNFEPLQRSRLNGSLPRPMVMATHDRMEVFRQIMMVRRSIEYSESTLLGHLSSLSKFCTPERNRYST